jgi:hypothetical protein
LGRCCGCRLVCSESCGGNKSSVPQHSCTQPARCNYIAQFSIVSVNKTSPTHVLCAISITVWKILTSEVDHTNLSGPRKSRVGVGSYCWNFSSYWISTINIS